MFPELPGEVQTIRAPPLGMGVDSECKIREHSGGDCPVSVSWPLLPPPGVSFIQWTVDMPVMCSAGLHWAFPLHFFHSTDCYSQSSFFRGQWRCTPREKLRLLGDQEEAPWAMFPLEALDFIVFTPHQRQWENIFIFHHCLPFLKKMFSVFSFYFADY